MTSDTFSNFDRFQSSYYFNVFPDIQDQELKPYTTCSGCKEVIYEHEVINGEILDVYGMAIHDDYQCLKKATEARLFKLEGNE